MPAFLDHNQNRATGFPEDWKSFKFTDTRQPMDESPSSSEPGTPSQRATTGVLEDIVQDQLNASFTCSHVQNEPETKEPASRASKECNTSFSSSINAVMQNGGKVTPEELSVTDSASFAYGHMDEDERNGGIFKKKDPKRRNTKMRFSFLMNEDGNGEMDGTTAKGRPSLLDVGLPPAVDIKKTPQGRDSSVESSFYFDAMEDQEQGASSQLCTITEDDNPNTVDPKTNSTTTSRPISTEKHTYQHETQPSFTSTTTASASFISDHEDEFDDMIVLTNVPYRTHTLPCTRATATTTTRLKTSAFSLMRYSESEAIFSGLLVRLERMLDTEIDIVAQDKRLPKPSLSRLARKLRDFLRRIAEGRKATGEENRMVEHELRLAEWMVEACREGVMHVRTRKCRCRPDWSGPVKGYY